MAQRKREFNGRLAFGKCILNDAHLTHPIDQSQIEPHIRKLPFGFTGKKFRSSRKDAFHLALPQTGSRTGEIGAFLDLDKDDLSAVAQDQIDFTSPTTPPFGGKLMGPRLIVTCNDIFGGVPRMIAN